MSVRDEMLAKLWDGCSHCRTASKGRIGKRSCATCESTVDALMPIVERAAGIVLSCRLS